MFTVTRTQVKPCSAGRLHGVLVPVIQHVLVFDVDCVHCSDGKNTVIMMFDKILLSFPVFFFFGIIEGVSHSFNTSSSSHKVIGISCVLISKL